MIKVKINRYLSSMIDTAPLKYLLFDYKPDYSKCLRVAELILSHYEKHLSSTGETGRFLKCPYQLYLIGNKMRTKRNSLDYGEKLPLPPVNKEWLATRIFVLASKRKYSNHLLISLTPDYENKENEQEGFLIHLDQDLTQ